MPLQVHRQASNMILAGAQINLTSQPKEIRKNTNICSQAIHSDTRSCHRQWRFLVWGALSGVLVRFMPAYLGGVGEEEKILEVGKLKQLLIWLKHRFRL
ncbi:hypothetical protein BD777DRAFT_123422 [Yarrowia lipolytica]|jgi:hypothetical protein|nr:hypothetical protein BD777DRAFT_123422 [Yarrowia lipolytica]